MDSKSAVKLLRCLLGIAIGLLFTVSRGEGQPPDNVDTSVKAESQDDGPKVAANEAVAEFMQKFAPRGVMSDGSLPTAPEVAVQQFQLDARLRIELVSSEPVVAQPLFLSWDSRGRLWVVQYRQYQFPAGLKIVKYDQHLRAVFDRVPEPPPTGPRGADVITVFSDTDGDGRYDQHQDVIQGLNIATAVQHGYGGIWVLNPPYLLFYPDPDGDGLPNSSPEVRLSGFGLQDTHSVANSLLFGPDGWIYGANGSTTTGNVSSSVSRGVSFEGQCIWRYDPNSQIFEIYAEGGGNTFSLDIDEAGRVFSGTNHGGTRGFYYPQGSYSSKNWGKHGPLTNPYALGYFHPMPSQGDDRRFPQAFCIYEGGWLPSDFDGTIVAPNSLHNLVWNSQRLPMGSTFRTEDRPNLLTTSDRWFRPVYAGVGPEGAIYLADWYDSRLSHVSPIDDWHKGSGRIYRILPKDWSPSTDQSDLSALSGQQLVARIADHPNKWQRQRAALELRWRRDLTCLPALESLVDSRGSLDALWAVHGLGGLQPERAERWLQHNNPHIRRWVVRLLGDRHEGLEPMVDLASIETDVEVRSQLAATAKRLEAGLGTRILSALLLRDEDADDPHVPLMIWWGLEKHVDCWQEMRKILSRPEVWKSSIMRRHLASRLMQRCVASALNSDWNRCQELVQMTEDPESRRAMMLGMLQAFEGRRIPPLPESLQSSLDQFQASLGQTGLLVGVRQGNQDSILEALALLGDENAELPIRLQLAKALAEQRVSAAEATLIRLACGHSEPSLQRVALASLRYFENPDIAGQLVPRMDSTISNEHALFDTACRTLAARPAWAEVLLREILQWRLNPKRVPPDVVQQLRAYSDDQLQPMVKQAFGQPIEVSSEERIAELQRLRSIDYSQPADIEAGRAHFANRCANCHRLFGEGKFVGPALDGYERGNLDFWLINMVDPSAEIREGFQSFSVLTSDGRLLTGMIEDRSGTSITLRSADDQRSELPVSDIDELRPLATSLMPDDLLKGLSPQEIRDLMAYLRLGVQQ